MANQINVLIPNHRKLNKQEVSSILEKYSLKDIFKLPKIKVKDVALAGLDIVIGDVVEIERTSFAGKTKYYRVVVD